VLDDVADLVSRPASVDSDQHPACLRHAEVRQEKGFGVECQEGNAVALPEPCRPQRGRETSRARSEITPRAGDVTVDDRNPIGMDGSRSLEKMDRTQLMPRDSYPGLVDLDLHSPDAASHSLWP